MHAEHLLSNLSDCTGSCITYKIEGPHDASADSSCAPYGVTLILHIFRHCLKAASQAHKVASSWATSTTLTLLDPET